ncbi:MAG: crotonase/enoyl-CoA hydratase family protein [Deltaproteobacteria bacterium]|nr:crotonase/enoyl-CoA hydratase family protein [Deltaproteobacteria bacterium]
MGHVVRYSESDKIATIGIDDGKANAVSFQFLDEINNALDLAERDRAVVILTGRPGKFSAGFDLSIVTKGGETATDLVRSGGRLALRLLGFPTPVILACNGHCLALGALLLLATDFRIGVEGEYKIGTNEVAIGMALPSASPPPTTLSFLSRSPVTSSMRVDTGASRSTLRAGRDFYGKARKGAWGLEIGLEFFIHEKGVPIS